MLNTDQMEQINVDSPRGTRRKRNKKLGRNHETKLKQFSLHQITWSILRSSEQDR